MKIDYLEITDTNNIHFAAAIEIYNESFPPNEQQPIQLILRRVEEGMLKLIAGLHNNEVICIAFLWHFSNSEFVLLDYMAVKEKYRNRKIGSVFFKYLTEKAVSSKKYLLFEVENYLFGKNSDQRKKRIEFYIENGAYILYDVPYILPSLDNTLPTEMLLMIAPKVHEDYLVKEQIELLIKRLYLELYNKNEKDDLLKSIIINIPNKILLINKLK